MSAQERWYGMDWHDAAVAVDDDDRYWITITIDSGNTEFSRGPFFESEIQEMIRVARTDWPGARVKVHRHVTAIRLVHNFDPIRKD